MISDERAEAAVSFIRDNSDLIGQLRGQKAYLEHRIKVERSQRFLDASGTVAEREAIGWTDSAVLGCINEHKDCVTELETLATRFKAAELTIETWRTQQANTRRGNV